MLKQIGLTRLHVKRLQRASTHSGGLTVFAAWLFVILPLLHYFGAGVVLESTGWVTLASTVVTAIAGGVVAWFTVVLARVGKQQIADTKILQRAYLSASNRRALNGWVSKRLLSAMWSSRTLANSLPPSSLVLL